ncbi:MAG: Crp/Fnr family transcriptional regulator [Thermodesulfobacteriota bacterium]
MQVHKSKLWYLNTNELFLELPEKDKKDMASMLRPMEVKKKTFIYYAGDMAETVYILKEGRIKITRLSEDGKELTIDILEPGDIFGELVLAGEEERETSAEALEDSFICIISRNNFEEFLRKRPHLSFKLMKKVGLRLRTIENRFEDMIFKDVHSRLTSIFKDLDKRYGIPVQRGQKIANFFRFRIGPSHSFRNDIHTDITMTKFFFSQDFYTFITLSQMALE